MRVAVTGAAGRLGKAVTLNLRESGHSVRGLDRAAGEGVGVADLRDRSQVVAALAGCDAVVHLAAWPTPHSAPAETVLGENVAMASNVLFAAAELGVRKAVVASSQSVLGLAWAGTVIAPDYLPVDEGHPCRPADAYSVSKLKTEELAAMLARAGQLDVRLLRFPVIWDHRDFAAATQNRIGRPQQGAKSQWAYVDQRDAARAVRLALEVPGTGVEILNITAPTAFAAEPTTSLVAGSYPRLTDIREDLAGNAAVFDWRRARQTLGFVARYRWSVDGIDEVPDV